MTLSEFVQSGDESMKRAVYEKVMDGMHRRQMEVMQRFAALMAGRGSAPKGG